MKIRFGILALAASLGGAAAPADDLTGKDRILCTAVQATTCTPEGECKSSPPWNLNIPQFLEINLKDKTVATTKASGENRASALKSVLRADGLIILQGIEDGRAFSFVIDESSGLASVAVARDEMTVSIFGACTPLADGK
jgi:hypothetical protein